MGRLVPLALLFVVAAPQRWVTDDAGVLTAEVRQRLDARLESYERASGHQLLVYVGRSTGGEPIEEWAARTFKDWRIGRKGLDDGAALFVFVDDRAARIEVGYGLEGVLTDAKSSRILRERLIPKMAAGDPNGAVAGAVDAMLAALGGGGGEAPPFEIPEELKRFQWIAIAVGVLAFIALAIWKPRLALFLLMMFTGRGGRREGRGGGFFGKGGRSGGAGATGRW